jgi:multiple sugar transport system substrate-binding protein
MYQGNKAPRRGRRRGLIAGSLVAALGAAAIVGSSAGAQSPAISGDITYWHHFTEENEMKGLEHAEEVFEADHPGTTVTSETVPNPDYMTKVVTAVQSDQRPDTAMISVDRLADMVEMGAVLPLTDRVKAWEHYDDFSPAVWDGITYNGEIYGIPAFSFVDVLFYRSDWFKEKGLTPPTNWDEFQAAAIALTDPAQGRYGFALRGGAGGAGWAMKVLESFGVDWLDDNGQPSIDRDALIKGLTFYTDLATKYAAVPPSAAGDGYTETVTGFKTDTTGMLFQSTGALADIASGLTPGEQFLSAPMPSGEGGPSGRLSALYNGMMSDENADASWEWLTHWGRDDAQIDFMKATGYFPPSTSAQQDPFIANDPIMAPAAAAAAAGVAETQFAGLPGFQADVLLPALQEILTGQKGVEQAADEIIAGLADAVN